MLCTNHQSSSLTDLPCIFFLFTKHLSIIIIVIWLQRLMNIRIFYLNLKSDLELTNYFINIIIFVFSRNAIIAVLFLKSYIIIV